MRKRLLILVAAISLLAVSAAPANAIVNGEEDNGEHPMVGQLLFYVPDDQDPRFTESGAWFTCTGTLLEATVVVTAGHCTYGVGEDGESTTANGGDGSGGTDVWFNVSEEPDYDILPPSSDFAPDGNDERYKAWSKALDESDEWVRATAHPHPAYDPNAFYLADAGVLVLDEAIELDAYGELPSLGLLDQLAKERDNLFTAVGYGLEESGPRTALGGDTRRKADVKLVNLQGVYGAGKGVAATFSSNQGKPHTGGTCFGDSGGPIFPEGTFVVAAVTSFGMSSTCSGGGGGYRLDQKDDLDFVNVFLD